MGHYGSGLNLVEFYHYYGSGLDLVGFFMVLVWIRYDSLWFWFGSGRILMLDICVFVVLVWIW